MILDAYIEKRLNKIVNEKFLSHGYDFYLFGTVLNIIHENNNILANNQRAIRLYRSYFWRKFFILTTIITKNYVIVFLPISKRTNDPTYYLSSRKIILPFSKLLLISTRVLENLKLMICALSPMTSPLEQAVEENYNQINRSQIYQRYHNLRPEFRHLRFLIYCIKTLTTTDLNVISYLNTYEDRDAIINLKVSSLGYLTSAQGLKFILWLDSLSIFLNIGPDKNTNDGTPRVSPYILALKSISEIKTPIDLNGIVDPKYLHKITVTKIKTADYKFPKKSNEFFHSKNRYSVFFADNPVAEPKWSLLCFPSSRQKPLYMFKSIRHFAKHSYDQNFVPVIAAKRNTLFKRKLYTKYLTALHLKYGAIVTDKTIALTDNKITFASGQPNTTPIYYSTQSGVHTYLPLVRHYDQ